MVKLLLEIGADRSLMVSLFSFRFPHCADSWTGRGRSDAVDACRGGGQGGYSCCVALAPAQPRRGARPDVSSSQEPVPAYGVH